MAKSVKVLCGPEVFFSIGEDKIPVGQLSLEQAELVAAQYPGQYVEIVDKKAPATSAEPTK